MTFFNHDLFIDLGYAGYGLFLAVLVYTFWKSVGPYLTAKGAALFQEDPPGLEDSVDNYYKAQEKQDQWVNEGGQDPAPRPKGKKKAMTSSEALKAAVPERIMAEVSRKPKKLRPRRSSGRKG